LTFKARKAIRNTMKLVEPNVALDNYGIHSRHVIFNTQSWVAV